MDWLLTFPLSIPSGSELLHFLKAINTEINGHRYEKKVENQLTANDISRIPTRNLPQLNKRGSLKLPQGAPNKYYGYIAAIFSPTPRALIGYFKFI